MMNLSIIVISHNQEKELQRCVESILAQQMPFAYELIQCTD
jgi:glycosyltransferase involved in cell wall biosynthesis